MNEKAFYKSNLAKRIRELKRKACELDLKIKVINTHELEEFKEPFEVTTLHKYLGIEIEDFEDYYKVYYSLKK